MLPLHPDEVLVGYLVTLPDGFECRMPADLTRVNNYAMRQRAICVEPMFVKRPPPGAALAGDPPA